MAVTYTELDKITLAIEQDIFNGKQHSVRTENQVCRVMSLGAGVFTGIVALQCARSMLGAGLSLGSIIVIPTGIIAGFLAYDSYRAFQCCNIVLKRVSDGSTPRNLPDLAGWVINRPEWVKKLREEVNKGMILPLLANWPAK
jgi:hypothetical protein